MISLSGLFVTMTPSGVNLNMIMGVPDLFGLIEATSKTGSLRVVSSGGDCPRHSVAHSMPNPRDRIGKSLVAKFRLRTARLVTIRAFLSLRSGPITQYIQRS